MNKVESALQRTTDTKALVIGSDALPRSAEMFKELFPGKRAIIVADKITYPLAGEAVKNDFDAAGIAQDEPHVYGYDDSFAEWTYVEELENVLKKTDAIPVAVGSGVINDLTKLTAHRCGRRYMCVGTAASMDGYTAYGASITYQGNKQTFDCPAPYGMALDPRIAAKAPQGDVGVGVCRSDRQDSCRRRLDDRRCRGSGGDRPLCVRSGAGRFAGGVERSRRGLQRRREEGGAIGRRTAAERFCHAGRQIEPSGVGHGAPVQPLLGYGGFGVRSGKHVSHGFKVGIGTLASTASLELLLAAPIESLDIDACVAKWKSWEETEKEILRIFDGKPGFIDRALTETKNKYVDKEGLRRELTAFKAAWPELKERIRKQIIPLPRRFAVA